MTVTFLGARPNLPAKDVATSAAFYRDVLGFTIEATMGEPPSFAILRRGGAEIVLLADERPAVSGCYIYVKGVDEIHDALAAKGVGVVVALQSYPWGTRDFVIEDLDGRRIAIGERVGTTYLIAWRSPVVVHSFMMGATSARQGRELCAAVFRSLLIGRGA